VKRELELNKTCYSFLPEECYQCFSNWTALMVGVSGKYIGARITLVGRRDHPFAQIGLGANNKVCFTTVHVDSTTAYMLYKEY